METVTLYYDKTSNKVIYLLDETINPRVFSFPIGDYLISKPPSLDSMGKIVLDRRTFLKGAIRIDKELSNYYYRNTIRIYLYWGWKYAYFETMRRLGLTMAYYPYGQIEFLKKADSDKK